MGLFDELLSGVTKSVGREVAKDVLPNLLKQVLGKTDLGGVGGLLAQLQKSGLGGQVASWLGNGSNMPVSADQLRDALGKGQLQQMADASGTPMDELLKTLAQHLPGAVDSMSPNGKLEADDAEEEKDDDAPDENKTTEESDATDDDKSESGGGSLAEKAGLSDIDSSGRR